jgi:gliding motility-associated lipoprotein GldB
MKNFLLITIVLSGLLSCNSNSEVEKEIEKISVDVELIRFDMIFGKATIKDLPDLKRQFPLFFPERFADSIWEQRVTDTLQQQLNEAVLEVFPSEEKLEDELFSLFQHIKYYFPNFIIPKVYTATSDIDYKNKVLVADSILILELDTYLGSDHPFYGGISKYITKNMKPSMVATDVAAAYSRTFIEVPKQRMLLAQMIFFGKELYLKDLWLPSATDAEKIGYTEAEWRWAQENEEYIWRFLIEKELLYSTDARLPSRFINPAPFSKFNLEIDNESPGMIGRYVGWKIVRAYMKNNDVNLQQLMRQHPEDLFKNSKYKPKK